MIKIADSGYWITDNKNDYHFDSKLASSLAEFFRGQSVVDFGCGQGEYVKAISKTADCRGYDGNPHTPKLTQGTCEVADLSQPLRLEKARWVLCLEVAEHLPTRCESTFLENIDLHNEIGCVLSWARPGQGGKGHLNERPFEYVVSKMLEMGYDYNIESSNLLRSISSLPWFKTNIMVFRKQGIELRISAEKSTLSRDRRAEKDFVPMMFTKNDKKKFTDDFVSPHTGLWMRLLSRLCGINRLRALEIGSHEGRSAVWWLSNILVGDQCTLTCIDSWEWKEGAEDVFDCMIGKDSNNHRVIKHKGRSRDIIPSLLDESYDFIYVDGSHEARDVLLDGLLCLPKLKKNGIIIFDDYEWSGTGQVVNELPKHGIDAFLRLCGDQVEILHRGYQVAVQTQDEIIK